MSRLLSGIQAPGLAEEAGIEPTIVGFKGPLPTPPEHTSRDGHEPSIFAITAVVLAALRTPAALVVAARSSVKLPSEVGASLLSMTWLAENLTLGDLGVTPFLRPAPDAMADL